MDSVVGDPSISCSEKEKGRILDDRPIRSRNKREGSCTEKEVTWYGGGGHPQSSSSRKKEEGRSTWVSIGGQERKFQIRDRREALFSLEREETLRASGKEWRKKKASSLMRGGPEDSTRREGAVL